MFTVVFMSSEHVSRMNNLLGSSPDVREACAALDRDYTIAYELHDGPDGGTVHWVLAFDRGTGARFSLEPVRTADLTYVGDWAAAIRTARAARAGEVTGADAFELRGDPSVPDRIADAYRTAQRVATIESELPSC
ncbi:MULTISPECIES: hypothetical protein [Pseudonocardia]|uniref:SCP2 domain-containing protein n=2 Tax=Pseudonocardia TaxID=1847 RepID=A0A1Y2MJ05_PSEAH|nr:MULTISPECIES: hypothetical protein [Pseudonocardia]OSY35230.1 hypothetical protein BG845_06204 [Pseudonocardia autotrophica]TDN73166.1 hypothetical protein C8E95_2246 [Pseudonocardia autotrophica]BBG03892.1 hypothetical protein Pdca_51010 [Pseudonocardia autotrophica]GEC28289.1 hypothetical protein PSA01_53180 [Pseudonocardia saturnea]